MSAFVDTVIRAFDRYLPEPFTFGLLMTLIAMLLTLGTTPSGPVEVLVAWGDGLSSLLPFITQVCLTILFAYTLAHLGPVARPLARLASLPSSARGAYVFCTFFTGIVCLIAWPLGTILGGLMARQVALSCNERGITVHYPLLAGAAFSGFVVWHMGYTGSAPLLVATEGHPMMALTGGIIDVSRTIFTPLNLLTIVVTLALVALAATRLEPVEPEPANSETAGAGAELDSIVHGEIARAGLAGALENARWPTLVTGLCLVAYVGWWFATRGLDLNLNIVNWTFLAACLLLCRSAKDLADVMMAGAAPSYQHSSSTRSTRESWASCSTRGSSPRWRACSPPLAAHRRCRSSPFFQVA